MPASLLETAAAPAAPALAAPASRRAGLRSLLEVRWAALATALFAAGAAWMTWSRAASRATEKLARSGSAPGAARVASAMAVRRAW